MWPGWSQAEKNMLMKMTRIIAMKANLSIPDRVNRAQPIFAIASWNFQVFELSWWIPIH